MKHDPYATAFKDTMYTNHKLLAKQMRADGMPYCIIKTETGVDYHIDNVAQSPLDPNFIDTRSKEDKADQQDMADERNGV